MTHRLTLLILSFFMIGFTFATERVSLKQLRQKGWDAYIGHTIQITDPLYVCGVYYDSLILAPHRLYVPEEHAVGLAQGDSTRYWQLVAQNKADQIVLKAKLSPWEIVAGCQIQGLKAKVTAPQSLLTGATPSFSHNHPHSRLPKRQGADIVVCSANLQNFFYHIGGYASAKTREQQDRQTLKVSLGLKYLNADIYALCEIERGNTTPTHLVNALNAITAKGRYAYVDNGHTDGDTISVGYIYRTDRVRPYGETYYAYNHPNNLYHYRFMVHGFEHIATGERFLISVNHPRSKRGPAEKSNRIRMENIGKILPSIQKAKAPQALNDSDVLMVGDYNCYTQEQPLQTLIQAGYADQLMRFDSLGYSYLYKGEIGYLDRVFASPSMAAQITMAHPVHLNADCFYTWGYKQGRNKTKFRYSDHDPILIGIRFLRPKK